MDDQLPQIALFLDKTIESLGIEAATLEDVDLANTDVGTVIKSFYQVILKNRDFQLQHEDLQHKYSRAHDDVTALRHTQAALQEALRKKEAEVASVQEQQRRMALKETLQTEQLKHSKEEVRKLKLDKQHLATHYGHFKKRQEMEHSKLKEKLQKLLNDKNNERKLGMKALNLIQRKGGARGQWANASKADEEMHRMIIVNYEERLKDVTLENKELRESLMLMEAELVQLVNGAAQQGDVDSSTLLAPSPLKPGHFELPFSESREGIQDSLKHNMTNLRERLSYLVNSAKSGSTNTNEILDLQAKVDECGRIIEQQRNALLEDGAPSPSKSFLSDSMLYDRADEIKKERQELEQERANAKVEREMFLKAATKLDHDRARIAAAKIQLPPTPLASAHGGTVNVSTPRVQSSLVPPQFSNLPASTPAANTAVDLTKYLQMDDSLS